MNVEEKVMAKETAANETGGQGVSAKGVGPHAGNGLGEAGRTGRVANGHGDMSGQDLKMIEEVTAASAASSAAVAETAIEQVFAQSLAISMINAVNAQQSGYIAGQAATLSAVRRLLADRETAAETGGKAADQTGAPAGKGGAAAVEKLQKTLAQAGTGAEAQMQASAAAVPDLTKNAGKIYQSLSQASAIAVQDATAHVRNVNVIATTAMGVAISQMLADGDPDGVMAIAAAVEKMNQAAVKHFTEVCAAASALNGSSPG